MLLSDCFRIFFYSRFLFSFYSFIQFNLDALWYIDDDDF